MQLTSPAEPQVALNQLALAPVVLTTVFAWNLLLTQKADEIPCKIRRDLVPTMINGEPVCTWHDGCTGMLPCLDTILSCCRVEVLDPRKFDQLLVDSCALSSALYVSLWAAMDCILVIFIQ